MDSKLAPRRVVELGRDNLEASVEFIDGSAMADALAMAQPVTFSGQPLDKVINNYVKDSKDADGRYAESLDTSELKLPPTAYPGDLSRLERPKALYALTNQFTGDIFESIKIGKPAPELLSLIKGANQGFLRKLKASKQAGMVIQRAKSEPEYIVDTIAGARLEIKSKIEKHYNSLFMFGLTGLAGSSEGNRLHLRDFLREARQRLIDIDSREYDDALEKYDERTHVFDAVTQKTLQVLERKRFISPQCREVYEALDNTMTNFSEWRQQEAGRDEAVERHEAYLWGRLAPLQEMPEAQVSDNHAGDSVDRSASEDMPSQQEVMPDPEVAVRQARIEERELALSKLQVQHGALMAPYRPTKKALRSEGYMLLNALLVKGLDVAAEDGYFGGMPDVDAYRVLGTLRGIDRLVQQSASHAEATESLGVTLLQEATSWQSYEAVKAALHELKKNGYTESWEMLSKDVDWLRDNHQLVEYLANEAGFPERSAVDAVYRVLFFNQLDQQEPRLSPAEDTIDTDMPGMNEVFISHEDETDNEPGTEEPVAEPITIEQRLINRAQKLGIKAFPRGEGLRRNLEDSVTHHYGRDTGGVEWLRMELLVDFAEALSGKVYQLEPGSMGTNQPWYVSFIPKPDGNGKGVAIVENPLFGNATYLIRDIEPGWWMEAVREDRLTARMVLDAIKINHPGKLDADSKKNGLLDQHRTNVNNALQNLLNIKD